MSTTFKLKPPTVSCLTLAWSLDLAVFSEGAAAPRPPGRLGEVFTLKRAARGDTPSVGEREGGETFRRTHSNSKLRATE